MDAVHGSGVKCWGDNYFGKLGDGTTTNSSVPVDVVGLTGSVTALTGGSYHTCVVLDTGGGAKCWGYNGEGQLGDGTTTDRHTPVDVSGLTSGVTALAAGRFSTCALTTGVGPKCWGWNGSGQLGDGTTIARSTPVSVIGLASGVAALTAGDSHTCAMLDAAHGGGVNAGGITGAVN